MMWRKRAGSCWRTCWSRRKTSVGCVYLSVCLSVCLSVRLSVCLYACRPVCLYVGLSVCVSNVCPDNMDAQPTNYLIISPRVRVRVCAHHH